MGCSRMTRPENDWSGVLREGDIPAVAVNWHEVTASESGDDLFPGGDLLDAEGTIGEVPEDTETEDED